MLCCGLATSERRTCPFWGARSCVRPRQGGLVEGRDGVASSSCTGENQRAEVEQGQRQSVT